MKPVDPVLLQYVDIAWKVGTVLGLALLYFLKGQFVEAKDYKEQRTEDKLRMDGFERAIILMSNNSDILKDHELRLRALEQRRHSHTYDGSKNS
jgi:hypothetical protein